MQKIHSDMGLGRIIQKIRRSKNMTQDQVLAKLQLMNINISKSTYAKIETNRMNIKVSELVTLKLIFDVSFDEFFSELIEEVNAISENDRT